MRVIGFLLAGCVALAVMQAAAKILALVIVAGLAVGLACRPKETGSLLLGLFCLGLMGRYPLVGVPVFGALVLIGAMKD